MSDTTVVQEAPVYVRPPHFTNDVLVDKLLQLRAKVAEIQKKQKDELAKYNVVMAQLEAMMLDELNVSKSQSIKTDKGTFFKTTKISVSVKEWQKTLDWIKDNDAWGLLEARVSKTNLLAIQEELNTTVPGVQISSEVGLNVRSPSAK